MNMDQNEATGITAVQNEGDPAELVGLLLGILRHRRWWFLTTASVVILGGLAVLTRIPNRYTSQATIIVAQQQVPERYVVPTSTTNLTKDLETMEGEVLSRTRLFMLIDEFHLYPKERKRLAPEQLLELMMKYIKVEPLTPRADKEADSFHVSFTAEDPLIAQAVTSRLASLFILNNVKGREDQAIHTTKFLKDHLESAQQRLAASEQKLREFKMQHLGELPEQQQGNLAILTGLQTQLQNASSAIARAQQQKVYLESLLNTLHGLNTADTARTAASKTVPTEPEPSDEAILGVEMRLARLRNEKKSLMDLRGADDPDVRNLNVDIARTDALLQKMKAERPQAQRVPETESSSIAQLKSQLQANQLEIENLTRDEKQLKASVAQYELRLNETPVREQQLASLSRDIDLVKQEYSDLLTKEQQSQLATSLEQQQGGEQFRLLEPPSLPTLPSSPKRTQLGLGVGVGGLALGLAVAFLADLRYRAFYSEKEISKAYPVSIVIGMPLFTTTAERRKKTWKAVCEWTAVCALGLIACTAELLYLHVWKLFL